MKKIAIFIIHIKNRRMQISVICFLFRRRTHSPQIIPAPTGAKKVRDGSRGAVSRSGPSYSAKKYHLDYRRSLRWHEVPSVLRGRPFFFD